MALQFFDGFEILPNQRPNYSYAGGSYFSAPAGRTGGKAILNLSATTMVCALPTPVAQIFLGVAFKEPGSGWGSTSAGGFLVSLYGDAGATGHLGINVSNDGHLYLRRGAGANGTVIATSTLIMPAINVWHYLEVSATIADAGGTCVVKIDGVEYINFTGDTKNGGTLTTVSSFSLGGFGGTTYDDLYVCDATGAAPYNTFLGDRVVKAARPDGAGAVTGLTPSAGSNYQCVDEDPWTTADYVSAGAVATDTYTFADVSGFSSVDAVQALAYALKTDAGARTLRTVMRSALGTSVESTDLALSTTVAVVPGPIRQTDPDAAPLTQTLINSAQYGVKVV